MRGGDDPHVDLARLRRPDALELAFLQHAQQLGLHVGGQVADLVEEQRAAVGQLEAALARRHRAGERAALVPEQLALDQRRRQRGAVHAHERPPAAALRLCTARANSSLPVPVSPRITTEASVGATFEHAAERDAQRRAVADDVLEVVGVTNLVPAAACRAAGTTRQANELARLLGALKRNRDEVREHLESGGDLRRPQDLAA